MSAEVSAVLRRAAALVRQGWCQGRYAESATGRRVAINSQAAVAWCLDGAVIHELEALGCDGYGVWTAINKYGNTVQFNDAENRTAEEVAALLERAARDAEAGR